MAETQTDGLEVLETREWIDSLDYVLSCTGAMPTNLNTSTLVDHCLSEIGECQAKDRLQVPTTTKLQGVPI